MGVLQPPRPNGTYAYGCYHLFFFQLNNGVIIMSGSNMMDAEIELRTNERHITDYIELFFLLNMASLIRRERLCGQQFSA